MGLNGAAFELWRMAEHEGWHKVDTARLPSNNILMSVVVTKGTAVGQSIQALATQIMTTLGTFWTNKAKGRDFRDFKEELKEWG